MGEFFRARQIPNVTVTALLVPRSRGQVRDPRQASPNSRAAPRVRPPTRSATTSVVVARPRPRRGARVGRAGAEDQERREARASPQAAEPVAVKATATVAASALPPAPPPACPPDRAFGGGGGGRRRHRRRRGRSGRGARLTGASLSSGVGRLALELETPNAPRLVGCGKEGHCPRFQEREGLITPQGSSTLNVMNSYVYITGQGLLTLQELSILIVMNSYRQLCDKGSQERVANP